MQLSIGLYTRRPLMLHLLSPLCSLCSGRMVFLHFMHAPCSNLRIFKLSVPSAYNLITQMPLWLSCLPTTGFCYVVLSTKPFLLTYFKISTPWILPNLWTIYNCSLFYFCLQYWLGNISHYFDACWFYTLLPSTRA